jgi:hypothetical protein
VAGAALRAKIRIADLVVVRMGNYKGEEEGEELPRRALAILLEAVPQAREPWRLGAIRK